MISFADADIIDRLSQAMHKTFASPDYQAVLKKLGNKQFTLNAEQSDACIKGEIDKWAAIADSAHTQINRSEDGAASVWIYAFFMSNNRALTPPIVGAIKLARPRNSAVLI